MLYRHFCTGSTYTAPTPKYIELLNYPGMVLTESSGFITLEECTGATTQQWTFEPYMQAKSGKFPGVSCLRSSNRS